MINIFPISVGQKIPLPFRRQLERYDISEVSEVAAKIIKEVSQEHPDVQFKIMITVKTP